MDKRVLSTEKRPNKLDHKASEKIMTLNIIQKLSAFTQETPEHTVNLGLGDSDSKPRKRSR